MNENIRLTLQEAINLALNKKQFVINGEKPINFLPKGTQADVLALEPKGHTVVLGAAGSGKTTMALLRAKHLSNLVDSPKVLVVTYNRALVAYMKNIQAATNSYNNKIVIETYHKFALGYLKSRGIDPKWGTVFNNSKMKLEMVNSILDHKRLEHPNESTFSRKAQVFIEEISYIQSLGIKSLSEYNNIDRIGRSSTYISRENRKWFFEVYTKYIEERNKRGILYDWDDFAPLVYEKLLSDTRTKLYKHIIVDEGQDFTPMMLKSLVHAIPENGTFTFFGDIAQQIYGSIMPWKSSDIIIRKTWKFAANYRNPSVIATFAQDITDHELWEDKGDEYVVPITQGPAEGAKPTLVKYGSMSDETIAIVKYLKGRSGRNVVVVKNNFFVFKIIQELKKNDINVTEIKNSYANVINDGFYVTTFHSVKGLEFDNIYIPYLNEDDFPDKGLFKFADSKDFIYANHLKLLYVAVTRTIQNVIMSYSGTLTKLFPDKSMNYNKIDYSK